MSEEMSDLHDNKKWLLLSMKQLELKISDENLLEKISGDDVVEIYDRNYIQLFRNFTFLKLCNYTLPDILENDVFQLYERNEVSKQRFVACCQNAVEGQSIEDARSYIKPHLMREAFSEKQQTFNVTYKSFIPVVDKSSAIVGTLIISNWQAL